jgi:hypothetical protein
MNPECTRDLCSSAGHTKNEILRRYGVPRLARPSDPENLSANLIEVILGLRFKLTDYSPECLKALTPAPFLSKLLD